MASCCCWVLYRWWLVQPWCTDVSWESWVWRVSKHNTAVPSNYLASTSAAPACNTEALKCYTTMDPDYYTTAHVAPSYYAECPKYFFPSYTTKGSSRPTTSRLPSTASPRHRSTKTVEYYTEAIMGKYFLFFHGNVNQLSNCQYSSY
jgi:hypothetical protein